MSENLLSQYSTLVKDFSALAKSVAAGDLLKVAKAGEWPAAFVVHHMADGELHFASRYLHAIGDESPSIQPFDEERYPERVNYAKRRVKTSLAAIVGIRSLVLEVLTNATVADWGKVSQHPELGPITLSELFEKADGHIVGHTQQLREIAANF